MTGSIRSVAIGVAAAVLALALGACSQTTYGTGTSPGMQTLQDLAGIADFSGGQDKPKIKYAANPNLVAPPPGTPLPVPGSVEKNVASNWPTDPDVEAKRVKQDAAAREKFCAEYTNRMLPECRDPGFRLNPSEQANLSRQPSQTLLNQSVDPALAAQSTPEQNARAMKLFAEAKGQVAVDENGKPVRRYLTDPPSDYRVPDPNAPVVFEKKKTNKWHWPWEKDTATSADSLSPDGTTQTTSTGTATTGGTPPG